MCSCDDGMSRPGSKNLCDEQRTQQQAGSERMHAWGTCSCPKFVSLWILACKNLIFTNCSILGFDPFHCHKSSQYHLQGARQAVWQCSGHWTQGLHHSLPEFMQIVSFVCLFFLVCCVFWFCFVCCLFFFWCLCF